MERVQKTFDVAVTPQAAYEGWADFESFPEFMEDVEEVRRTGDGRYHWRASIAGREKEWDSEVTEQVPGRVLAWRSVAGPANGGRVTFQPLGDGGTRIHVVMEYEPESALEKVGDKLGLVSHKIEKTVEDFRQHLEQRSRA